MADLRLASSNAAEYVHDGVKSELAVADVPDDNDVDEDVDADADVGAGVGAGVDIDVDVAFDENAWMHI